MTAARSPRSAALLVGSHIVDVGERPERGRQLQEVLRERANVPLPFSGRAPLEQRPHLSLDRGDALLQCGAVAVLLELPPAMEDVPGHLEPIKPERLLGGPGLGVHRLLQ